MSLKDEYKYVLIQNQLSSINTKIQLINNEIYELKKNSGSHYQDNLWKDLGIISYG
jgi:hypothetical protein